MKEMNIENTANARELNQISHISDESVLAARTCLHDRDRDGERPRNGARVRLSLVDHCTSCELPLIRDTEHDTTITRMPGLGGWSVHRGRLESGITAARKGSWRDLCVRPFPRPFMACSVAIKRSTLPPLPPNHQPALLSIGLRSLPLVSCDNDR